MGDRRRESNFVLAVGGRKWVKVWWSMTERRVFVLDVVDYREEHREWVMRVIKQMTAGAVADPGLTKQNKNTGTGKCWEHWPLMLEADTSLDLI